MFILVLSFLVDLSPQSLFVSTQWKNHLNGRIAVDQSCAVVCVQTNSPSDDNENYDTKITVEETSSSFFSLSLYFFFSNSYVSKKVKTFKLYVQAKSVSHNICFHVFRIYLTLHLNRFSKVYHGFLYWFPIFQAASGFHLFPYVSLAHTWNLR